FLASHEGEVRYHHFRSHSSLGERGRYALHARLFSAGAKALESRRHGHAMGSAVRQQLRRSAIGNCHVLSSVSTWHHLEQRRPRQRLRYGAAWPSRFHTRLARRCTAEDRYGCTREALGWKQLSSRGSIARRSELSLADRFDRHVRR